MGNDVRGGGDLVLAPGEYAFVLDSTKGQVSTIVGPNKVSLSNTDQPVVWDPEARRFRRVTADEAIMIDAVAPEGYYIALYNPADGDKHPTNGTSTNSVQLQIGHRVNIPGPANFSLWPGQKAKVIHGHHLRSNQYLLAQVYNDVEAAKNWKAAVIKPTGEASATPPAPRSFTPGELLIIEGTAVAFFIPPTGIKVLPDAADNLVRDAVTLERLEYCILLDEDGNKRFVQGPDVVFPKPTETFVERDGERKFRAIELNETTGLYIKVIADYDEDGKHYKAGDELFITGKEQAIYFQREEHSVIRYGNQTKHYAVAIPAGEGRYVLDRNTGVIDLIRGPKMLLCDPRHQVIVRRVLADNTVKLWYPGNETVLKVNQELAKLTAEVIAQSATMGGSAAPLSGGTITHAMASNPTQFAASIPSNYAMGSRSLSALNAMDEAATVASRQVKGETFQRGSTFTPPRTITLDTKYEGAVSIVVWTGYAVMVINKSGDRRVVVGPAPLLLEYDETLAPLELSTGAPKTSEKLYRTVYLRVHNNRVSDLITIETKDLVKISLRVAYRVNFEGEDQERWFAVENYVRLLTDHMRSMIRNAAKRKNVEEFYPDAIDIIRNTVLGSAVDGGTRPGRPFAENNMRVYDLEVLDVRIETPNVAQLLNDAQMDALKSAVNLAKAERELAYVKRAEVITREKTAELTQTKIALDTAKTEEAQSKFALDSIQASLENEITTQRLEARIADEDLQLEITSAEISRRQISEDQLHAIALRTLERELQKMEADTKSTVDRATAMQGPLTTALTVFADQQLTERAATALGPLSAMSGVSVADILANLFKGTPVAEGLKQLATRARPYATVEPR